MECPECNGRLHWSLYEGLLCERCGLVIKNPLFLEKVPIFW